MTEWLTDLLTYWLTEWMDGWMNEWMDEWMQCLDWAETRRNDVLLLFWTPERRYSTSCRYQPVEHVE